MTDKNLSLTLPFFLALFFSLVSCSHHAQDKMVSPEKIYSASTQREFETIEKGDIQKKSIPNAHEIHHQQSLPSRPLPQKEAKINPPAPIESPKLSPDGPLTIRNQERLQEINQNLAFFCMKHRNERAFSSEEQCLRFTKRVLKACEKKHKLINTVMVNCIKDRLKKRK